MPLSPSLLCPYTVTTLMYTGPWWWVHGVQLGGEAEGCIPPLCPPAPPKLLSFVALPEISYDPFLVETYSQFPQVMEEI